MKKLSISILFLLPIFILSGCLTAQYKEYKIHFNDKHSGTLTITYRNIFSQISDKDNADSVLTSDYAELVSKYLAGNEIEKNFPDAKVKSKRLFENNGQLCGEVVLEFTDPSQVHLFKYDRRSPWMFAIPSDEDYFDSNGDKPADYMPVVFWKRNFKDDFSVITQISNPEGKDQSLLATWKKNNH
jgi:hypothetical protein